MAVALIVDLAIGAAKVVAFLLTGSTAIMAELLHSLADTTTQILLVIGRAKAGLSPAEADVARSTTWRRRSRASGKVVVNELRTATTTEGISHHGVQSLAVTPGFFSARLHVDGWLAFSEPDRSRLRSAA